jgi:hypothetical protein
VPLFQVVIGKKTSDAQTAGTSRKPKETPIINLSDDKEVFGFRRCLDTFFYLFLS